jgi:hypothetical protein
VAGQNVRNVNYTMDGSNNNDTFNGGNGGAQARVPIEAVQEFQLLTGQFDAEYGLSSGGIVNSVSKAGTNQFRGSAFGFFQDDKFTSRDYFAEKEDLPLPPTKQQQFGGTLGGPIVRDKAHVFLSVERVILDGGVTMNVPSRPEYNRTDFETTRVWNTFVRGDHQLNAGNTWGLRWLRETSPQPVQLNATNWTPTRLEAETDVDWTLVGNLSSVIGARKVNTFRVSAVKEDVFFGNPEFNASKDQKSLPPTLNHPSFGDSQSARANRRLDVAYGADNTFAWFVPDKRGDHDLKFGVNYLYSTLRVEDYQQRAHLPGAILDSRAQRVEFSHQGTLPGRVRAGQVEAERPPHAQPGRAIRHRVRSDAQSGESALPGRRFRQVPDRQGQFLSSVRVLVLAGQRQTVGAARRRRALLPADVLHVPDRVLLERPELGLVHRDVPDQPGGSGPAQRPVPDRSVSRQRPGRRSCGHRRTLSSGYPTAQHRGRAFR